MLLGNIKEVKNGRVIIKDAWSEEARQAAKEARSHGSVSLKETESNPEKSKKPAKLKSAKSKPPLRQRIGKSLSEFKRKAEEQATASRGLVEKANKFAGQREVK